MSVPRLLLHTARLDIFQPNTATSADLKGWVANQNYFIDADIQANEFTLRASSPQELASALGNDLNRLAAAAFESAAGIKSDQALPRSLAWGAIRSYYSAFFAAHAFMRLYGVACSQLESEHVDRVIASARTFGRAGGLNSLDSGFFSVEIDPAFKTATFRRLRESHRDTWNVFLSVVQALDAAIPNAVGLSKHKMEAAALIGDIKTGLTRSRSPKGNWLSMVRNSINYQQSHGVWFPYSAKATREDLLDTVSRSWLAAPPGNVTLAATDLEVFFGVAVQIVATLRELLSTGASLVDPLNPMMKNGCMKLLNDVQAARRAAGATH
jgi:hypothetical protein